MTGDTAVSRAEPAIGVAAPSRSIPPPPNGPPPEPVDTRALAVRAVLIGGYVGALVASLLTVGVPTEREQVLAWMMAGLVVVSSGGRAGRAVAVIRDWLPFALVLFLYDLSRGAADDLGLAVHWTPQIRLDRMIGFGHVPTVWLQDHLLDPQRVHVWEIVPSVVYISHFVVPFAVAAVLWARDRARWAGYARRFVLLSFLGVATFVLVPAAPPWLAGRAGRLPPVGRSVGRGWSLVGLDIASRMLHRGQATVNLVAAVPSLHAAYAALVAVFLWNGLRSVGRVVVVSYALLMAFTLVLSGEHYVVDILLGWVYVAVVSVTMARIEAWWRRRSSVRVAPAAAPAGAARSVSGTAAAP